MMILASDIQHGGLTYIIRSLSDIRRAYRDGRGFEHGGGENLAQSVDAANRQYNPLWLIPL